MCECHYDSQLQHTQQVRHTLFVPDYIASSRPAYPVHQLYINTQSAGSKADYLCRSASAMQVCSAVPKCHAATQGYSASSVDGTLADRADWAPPLLHQDLHQDSGQC